VGQQAASVLTEPLNDRLDLWNEAIGFLDCEVFALFHRVVPSRLQPTCDEASSRHTTSIIEWRRLFLDRCPCYTGTLPTIVATLITALIALVLAVPLAGQAYAQDPGGYAQDSAEGVSHANP
jgi:hypothetical protein